MLNGKGSEGIFAPFLNAHPRCHASPVHDTSRPRPDPAAGSPMANGHHPWRPCVNPYAA